ncbi:MAG: hypothetical protein V2I67_14210 [Thermoanaerobaculales bacterium]|nr:hypothetical protein [Thermoanaerobaculales bacterium]
MRVTPSARQDLLEAVARLRRLDPDRAAHFVVELEDRLTGPNSDLESVPELGSAQHSSAAGDGHRFYVRQRSDGDWLIAVWPEPELRSDPRSD